MLDISIINCLSDNYSYLSKETNLVGVVDPSEFNAVDLKITKTYKKLDFILNTHHHDDHVGGNLELKKKYNAKVISSSHEKNKIPGSDIKKGHNDKFNFGKTIFRVIYIPGHTLGHIAFYSENAKVIFTGDTLFSLGCGRIFEGTFEQMFESLEKINNLPKETKIYCGHEYTFKNGEFCISIDEHNQKLKDKLKKINNKIEKGLPTIPTTLEDEIETNIFLRCENNKIKNKIKMDNASKFEVFTKLRNLKDKF